VLVALGSNRCHGRHGPPRAVLEAALKVLDARGAVPLRVSRILETAPLGPSNRRFANAVAEVQWDGSPEALLDLLQQIEHAFGRRRWRRWGARVLDLDLLAFGQMKLDGRRLQLPHPDLHRRDFVLRPLEDVAPDWRHPRLELSVRHMACRLARARPLDRARPI
jgi:2-amino-4-hydroxy-6-hydroxymethyldihydropteridine diphosphokinase